MTRTKLPPTWLGLIISLMVSAAAFAAHDVPVPSSCTADVNEKISQLIEAGQQKPVDNVMVCGVTASSSRTQYGGRHGDHQIIPLRVNVPGGGMKLIEVVTNDDLEGKITAPANATVFAYGQAFFYHTKNFSAGIHEVHCATHRGADNGWIVINGEKHPTSCSR